MEVEKARVERFLLLALAQVSRLFCFSDVCAGIVSSHLAGLYAAWQEALEGSWVT